ncbi:hypothetical protein REPUB_Repub02eG0030900 [Reevesia pubescens]
MQGLIRGLRSCEETAKFSILKNSRFGCVTSSHPAAMEMQEKGLENMTVTDVLMTKGEENVGSWLWCRINDNVDDAMKNMAEHNIGSLVVLKPGDQLHIAGIITERDYLRKIIGQGRSPKYTKVQEIMTDEQMTMIKAQARVKNNIRKLNKSISKHGSNHIVHVVLLALCCFFCCLHMLQIVQNMKFARPLNIASS